MSGPGPSRAEEELPGDADFMLDTKPVGQDFIEEVLNEGGKTVCFTCTLCECRFNDRGAKNQHLKGRKHRIQYKKKVDPTYIVNDIKSDRKQVETARRQSMKKTPVNPEVEAYSGDINPFAEFWCRIFEWSHLDFKEDLQTLKYMQQVPITYSNKTVSDLLIEYKHKISVAPADMMNHIYMAVAMIERGLLSIAAVTDKLFIDLQYEDTVQERAKKSNAIDDEKFHSMAESGDFIKLIQEFDADMEKQKEKPLSELIRVVRIGHLGKGCVLASDKLVEVAVLCDFFPTELYSKIMFTILPVHLNNVQNRYVFEVQQEKAGFLLTITEIASIPEEEEVEVDTTKKQLFTIQIRVTFTALHFRYASPDIINRKCV